MMLEDLYRLLRSGHVQTQGIVDTLREPLIVLDQNFCVVTANPAFFEVFRVDREETLGQSLFELGSGQWDIADLKSLLSDVVPKSAAIVGYEVAHVFPNIGERIMLVSARRLWHPDHSSTQMLIVFEDVTDRRQEIAAKDILLSETRHRMKNLLAVVRSLATQTQAEGRTGEEYRDAFLGRLEAMLSAQDMSLSNTDETDIAMILNNILQWQDRDRLVVLQGPSFRVPMAQVGPLSMIVHELTTNAVKHGALSNDIGKVHISWTVEPHEGHGRLALDWREEGGPHVSAPSRRGFGTDLVEFSASSMMGEAVLDYYPSGLHVRLTLPAL
ncbi:HWE histidine kinase domain-containing protein [Devosia submarina]|uniref:HWE histidine kinase domain-containing protein n=1 Tax=Devosia submarina TaxID=1173082 RepID=UPI000D36C5E7|nr:HWE histidine kinase domain-containing protein [Devosia submarina]